MADLLPAAVARTPIGTVYRGALRYLRVLRALAALLAATQRARPTELWLGDSHAIFLNKPYDSGVLTRAPEAQLVWHLGPRLMYSLARDGFSPRVRWAARVLRAVSRPGSLVPVFIAGEIDVRCHLVPRAGRADFLDFVDDYVEQTLDLATALGARALVVAVPVPPSDDCPANPLFPIEGSIAERIAVFDQLRGALADAIGRRGDRTPRVQLLDATVLLADHDGALHRDLTDDGCHTNEAGVRLVRGLVRSVGLDGRLAQPMSVRS